jgi:hypothetical protein
VEDSIRYDVRHIGMLKMHYGRNEGRVIGYRVDDITTIDLVDENGNRSDVILSSDTDGNLVISPVEPGQAIPTDRIRHYHGLWVVKKPTADPSDYSQDAYDVWEIKKTPWGFETAELLENPPFARRDDPTQSNRD